MTCSHKGFFLLHICKKYRLYMNKYKFLALLFISTGTIAQTAPPATRVGSYVGIVHPIYTVQKGKISTNFKNYYQVGMTTGVVIRKSDKYAYNLELVGFVRHENGITKSNNFLFHPGVTLFGKKGFSVTPRMGYESNGRFGPSVIVGKTVAKFGQHSFNVIVPTLIRFGNDAGASFTQALHFSVGF
jgi:hypothetical protein